MKSRRFNIAFFLFGAGVFAYLVSRFGVDRILQNIERAGWSLLYIVLVWLIVYLLNTLAWKLVLGESGRRITFAQLFMVTVSGFVINYITPFLALGGEPYKVKALSGELGTQRSLSAVVLYRMVHLLGHMLFLLTGLLVALLVLSLPLAVSGALIVSAIVISAVVLLTLLGHRQGVFTPMQRVVNRLRILRPLARLLGKYTESLVEMDTALTEVYHKDRKKFSAAILLEYMSRVCMAFEVYLILRGVGVETGLVAAIFLYVVYSIVINLLFFIPLNLGAREGGLYLGLGSLAITPLLGIYLGVVMRIREFVWILIGLLFIPLATRKRPEPETAAEQIPL
ncbi:MAG: flippase-like domain-containing protein [Ignavibacteria bacterium]|nr:flippase-like domain-containing protein [Ignavibacteria bacterium]